ncbi:DUF1963 domain-containing protein [Streptomyces afghaniensis]|uniref:DUF1963 domain-containing protein n=1 Tax=Streptomyces afghaniensis TaxID=66865 RepID=UPI00379649F7
MTDETTDRLHRFRAEAASRGLSPQDVEEWIRVALPTVYMAQGGDGPLVAQVGGDPVMPHSAPEPRLPFVASVDLAALADAGRHLLLPSDGHLLLFAEPDLDDFQGLVHDAVMYVPAGTPTTRRPVEDSRRKPYRPRQLHTLWHQLCSQTDASFAEDRWGDPDEHQYALAEELNNAWSRTGGWRPPWDLQVGGHPIVFQNDPVHWARGSTPDSEDALGDEWTLLATWRCGDDVTELDAGIIHWVIRRGDLAALRFDRVHGYVDIC